LSAFCSSSSSFVAVLFLRGKPTRFTFGLVGSKAENESKNG
jgi:hypothetical protein